MICSASRRPHSWETPDPSIHPPTIQPSVSSSINHHLTRTPRGTGDSPGLVRRLGHLLTPLPPASRLLRSHPPPLLFQLVSFVWLNGVAGVNKVRQVCGMGPTWPSGTARGSCLIPMGAGGRLHFVWFESYGVARARILGAGRVWRRGNMEGCAVPHKSIKRLLLLVTGPSGTVV